MSLAKDIRNYFFPAFSLGAQRSNKAASPNSYPMPVRFERIKVDVAALKEAVGEAEQAYFPHRVKLQRIYQDTIRNGQITAAMNALKELVLLKDFEVKVGDKVDEKATELLKEEWFGTLQSYMFDKYFFGYTLIGLGDLIDNKFPKIELVRRWNVSPDRHNLTSYVYSLSGIDFLDPEVKDDSGNSFYDWTIWVSTPSDTGASPCGYGLLFKLAYYEIMMRHNTGYNATFNENFGQPIRKGVTTKTDEFERAEFATMLRDLGSQGWILLDPTDQVDLIETATGTGKQNGFDNFEQRMIKMINKIVLGHADALDSQTGKLGGEDAAKEAIKKKEKHYTKLMEDDINTNVFPKLINLGFPIPMGAKLSYSNKAEEVERRKNEDENNKVTAEIAQTMKNAGLQMDEKYFSERTGIPCKRVEEQSPAEPNFDPKLKKKLSNLYDGRVQGGV